jgi:hypothetical protein
LSFHTTASPSPKVDDDWLDPTASANDIPEIAAKAHFEEIHLNRSSDVWVPKTRPGVLSRRFARRYRIRAGLTGREQIRRDDARASCSSLPCFVGVRKDAAIRISS